MESKRFRVVVDRSHDPVKNIGREEAIFRRMSKGKGPSLARFWVDSECLVRGKAKNPRYGWYREELARRWKVKVIERTTGGGVVYHDLGNLNWSFYLAGDGRLSSPTQMFERGSKYIIEALRSLGVPAEFAPPNRIDVEGRKVSGMAARATPWLMLVHGTLLLRTDLEKLNRLCVPPTGCPPVSNVSELANSINAEDVVRAFVKNLRGSGAKVRVAPIPGNMAI
jgi:lipoate---protein ligase